MPKGKAEKPMVIHRCGGLRECELSKECMDDYLSTVDDKGKFIMVYELDNGSMGGHIFSQRTSKLTGRMFEYENVFVVIWSCGESVDCGIFRKEKSEEEK